MQMPCTVIAFRHGYLQPIEYAHRRARIHAARPRAPSNDAVVAASLQAAGALTNVLSSNQREHVELTTARTIKSSPLMVRTSTMNR